MLILIIVLKFKSTDKLAEFNDAIIVKDNENLKLPIS